MSLLGAFRSRAALQFEIVALRHEINVLHRSSKRPKLTDADRVFWGWLSDHAGSLYTILAAYDQRTFSWATIRMRVIPGVSWLWVGGAVVGIGALIAALPAPRRRATPGRRGSR